MEISQNYTVAEHVSEVDKLEKQVREGGEPVNDMTIWQKYLVPRHPSTEHFAKTKYNLFDCSFVERRNKQDLIRRVRNITFSDWFKKQGAVLTKWAHWWRWKSKQNTKRSYWLLQLWKRCIIWKECRDPKKPAKDQNNIKAFHIQEKIL